MSCKRCASAQVKDFNGELAIHFPGLEGVEKSIVWAFPELLICLHCGFVEFEIPEEPLEQLKDPDLPAQSLGSGRAS